ncbi:Arc family DNA-binding protein [Bradyrhizobium sp.]|uniref:Arc family DNA-binding protein n=1 Tax=Bradyrhizobium sp. TaxID=376 RepID=UPI002DDD4834|nr:Arc family DNA-binding protein [Bradyrhizobium sp.]HEV2156353.1 Arc family DNA-binding protein [Bradyrhizobium sp.]
MSSDVPSIPVRVPDELRQRLEAEAKASDRRLSAEIRVLLQEALKSRAEQGAAA